MDSDSDYQLPLGSPVQLLTSPHHRTSTHRATSKPGPSEELSSYMNLASPPPIPKQHQQRSQSPQESQPGDPPQRKRVRSSLDSSATFSRSSPSRKWSAAGNGSPLNPQNPRHAALSMASTAAHGKRRAENAFEHNPMYEAGMDIFQDPLSSNPILDSKVSDLQRRTRELGPAPLPSKSPLGRSGSPLSPPTTSPRTPSSSTVPRPSLDAALAGVSVARNKSSITPSTTLPNSPATVRSLEYRAFSPDPAAVSPASALHRVVSASAASPETARKADGKRVIKHLIFDLKAKDKGKEKEKERAAQDEQLYRQAEERVAAIRASPIAHDPDVLQRVRATADQLGRRYGAIYRNLSAGEPPPNPLDAIRWRRARLEHPSTVPVLNRQSNHRHTTPFDVPPVIDEEPSVDTVREELYPPSERQFLAWVKSLNTLHLEGIPSDQSAGKKEMKEWHLTSSVIEAYQAALQANGRDSLKQRLLAPLSDSPISSHVFTDYADHHETPPLANLRRMSDSRRSSTSASSQGRVASGPSSFKLPFAVPGRTSDNPSPSSSQNSEEAHANAPQPPIMEVPSESPSQMNGVPVISAPVSRKRSGSKPPTIVPSTSSPFPNGNGSRRSSIDTGFASDEPSVLPKPSRHRIRNSLPGIIDSSKASLTQLLSPLTGSSSNPTLPSGRLVATSPHPSLHSSSRARKTHLSPPQSDGEGSVHSSQSDLARSPHPSASEDNRHGLTALAKFKRRAQRDSVSRKGIGALADLLEGDGDRAASHSTSISQLPSPPVLNPDGPEPSTSDEDFSLKRGLGITKAGKKVAKSWNALTEKVSKNGLYDERTTAESQQEDVPERRRVVRLDTNATEVPGTTSDRLFRMGQMRVPRPQQRSQQDLESRKARQQMHEQRERAAYAQRLSLVMESHRQSDAVNYILQIAVSAISDYATHQAALSETLGVNVGPLISSSLFDLLHSPPVSDEVGWRAVEEDHKRRLERRAALNKYLASIETPWSEAFEDAEVLHDILDLVPHLRDQIARIEEIAHNLDDHIEDLRELNAEIMESLDEEEVEFARVAELIESSYPELARNEALARQLQPDAPSQILPDSVPDWAQSLILWLSPGVGVLASWLLAFVNQIMECFPESWVEGFFEFAVRCASTLFGAAQVINIWCHIIIQSPYIRPLLRLLSPIITESFSHPLRSAAFLASTLWLWRFLSSHIDNNRASPPLVVQYSNV